MDKKRIRDYGIVPGRMETGSGNRITDVPGVLVGHCTVRDQAHQTGVTVIVPGEGNSFSLKYTAAAYVHNGFGKSCGLIQVEELGTLETPIALTNTLNVGLVWDAVAEHVLDQCRADGVEALSINPVVGECNDSRINQICSRAVNAGHVSQAFAAAGKSFQEGDVGAGAGTVCYGLKGGIGSASRVFSIGGNRYTLGVLVQSNFGATEDFVLNGFPAGQEILKQRRQRQGQDGSQSGGQGSDREKLASSAQDKGSIMTILATDLPVTSRQLKRIIRRAGVGIARTGAYTGNGSGEVMIGFTTANRIPAQGGELLSLQAIPEGTINLAFAAAAEATHEAILNSMVCAAPAVGRKGERYESLAELMPELLAAGCR